MAISTERLLKKTVVLEALGDGKFSLSVQGIDKPVTIMADEVFVVRANAKQLVLLRKTALLRSVGRRRPCDRFVTRDGTALRRRDRSDGSTGKPVTRDGAHNA